MKFSIIVVALNPGEKLKKTVDSVLCQSCEDYEVVVKDGGSTDSSLDALPENPRIRVLAEADRGIYDAMNQAVARAQGEYILFLNCGDMFVDGSVLARAADCIGRERKKEMSGSVNRDAVIAEGSERVPLVIYGDTYGARNGVLISSPAKIDGFACYRNIPCHQSCFYEAKLCKEKPFDLQYRIRADYDHFLWCYYQAGAEMVHMGGSVSAYEGGGFSESKENRRRDREEHRQITEKYMPQRELAGYRRAMLLTLAPLRSFLAENRMTSGVYHRMKELIYHHGR